MKIIRHSKNYYYQLSNFTPERVADFYFLTWLKHIAKTNIIGAEDGDESLYVSLEKGVEDIVSATKQELLDSLLISINAEFRHVVDENDDEKLVKYFDDKGYGEIMGPYISLTRDVLDGNYDADEINGEKYDKDVNKEAYAYQMDVFERSKVPEGVLVVMARDAFNDLIWRHMFGGESWSQICQGWIDLANSKTLETDVVQIDHVFDLAHNTGHALDKTTKYSGSFLKMFLDAKKYMNNPWYLFPMASVSARMLAVPILRKAGIKIPDNLVNKINFGPSQHPYQGKHTWNGGTWKGDRWEGGTWGSGTWKSGVWETGVWYNGDWEDGIWKDGYFLYGRWYNGTWLGGKFGGTWFDGTCKGGTFIGAVWNDGVFEGGLFAKGTWHGGTFKGGSMIYSTWDDGIFEGGTWEGGKFLAGEFKGGTWEKGFWSGGEWKGGEWKDGWIWDSNYGKYIRSDTNPAEYFSVKESAVKSVLEKNKEQDLPIVEPQTASLAGSMVEEGDVEKYPSMFMGKPGTSEVHVVNNLASGLNWYKLGKLL